MDDLISRQAAIDVIQKLYPRMPRIDFMDNISNWRKKYAKYIECENAVKNLPSAQPEIIRCKDCKHRAEIAPEGWHPCNEVPVNDNWFCADGERREE